MSLLFSFVLKSLVPFRRYLLGLLSVAIGWSIVVNTQPYIVKLIIDRVVVLKGAALAHELLSLFAIYASLGLFFVSLLAYYDRLVMLFVPKQKEFITVILMNRMMKHSTSFYQKHFAGNLTSKVNDIVLYLPEMIKIFLDDFATCFFTLIFVLYNVSRVAPKFAWALLIWLTVFLGGALFLLFRNTRLAHASAEARSHVLGHIVDMFSNILAIRLFGRRRYELGFLRQVTGRAVSKEKKRDLFFLKLHAFQGVSFWIFEIICVWWLLQGISAGSITTGSFVLVFTLNLQVLDQFWNLGKEIREVWEKLGHLQQALRTIYMQSDLVQLPHAKTLDVMQGVIVFDHVHFFYEGSTPLFEEKTLTIHSHQKVGLVGYSGSGKSTFVNLVLRLYDVTKGQIFIDGQDIKDVTQNSLHQSIGVIPQDCVLFNRTILENIRYGCPEASDEDIKKAAQKAQIHDMIERLPHGYQTMAGEKGARFSGGQRQRIAIARAILKNAPILILDEATSHLDLLTEEHLRHVFRELMQDKTVLVIAHRLSTLVDMNRILVFDRGHIVQDGSHEMLIEEEGLYRSLWNAQMGGLLPTHRGL